MHLRSALIIVSLLITTAITLVLTYQLVDMERQDALADLNNTITKNNKLISQVNLAPLYNLDEESLNNNLDSFFTDQNILEITLEEYNGNILLKRIRKSTIPNAKLIKSRVKIVKDKEPLGFVATTYTTTFIEQNLIESRNRHLFISTILLLTFSLLTYLFINRFTAPIKRLTNATEDIAAGQLDKEVESTNIYELAKLADSFNTMRNSIKDKIADLANKNLALEEAISKYMATEKELLSSQTKFSRLFMATPAMTTLINMDNQQILDVNDIFINTTGYQRADIIGKRIDELYLYSDENRYHQGLEVVRSMGSLKDYEVELLDRQGTAKHFIWSAEQISLDKEHLLLNLFLDVSARKHAENENNYLKNLLKDTFNSMPSALVSVNYSGEIIQYNNLAAKITGVDAKQAEGQIFSNLLPFPIKLSDIQQSIDKKEITKIGKGSQAFDKRFFDITVYPLTESGVQGAVIRADDISEKMKIEQVMIQSEKMMSIGGLAAGMAHEINNPLAGIMQNLQVIINRTRPNLKKNIDVANDCNIDIDSLYEYLEKREIFQMLNGVMDSSQRAAKIVENMLNFSRKSSFAYEKTNIIELIDQALELVGSDYSLKKNFDFKHIRIIRKFADNLRPVYCDRTKIQQVILNLLKNGAQAMENSTVNNQSPCFCLTAEQVGDQFVFEVEDNGPGMEEEVTRRVFEPFFTTKEVGEGTGLGLSVSYFIITEDHLGSMTVQSSPGKGSTFTISIPNEY